MQTIRAAKLQGVGVISFSSVKKYTWEKSKYEFEDIFTMWRGILMFTTHQMDCLFKPWFRD